MTDPEPDEVLARALHRYPARRDPAHPWPVETGSPYELRIAFHGTTADACTDTFILTTPEADAWAADVAKLLSEEHAVWFRDADGTRRVASASNIALSAVMLAYADDEDTVSESEQASPSSNPMVDLANMMEGLNSMLNREEEGR